MKSKAENQKKKLEIGRNRGVPWLAMGSALGIVLLLMVGWIVLRDPFGITSPPQRAKAALVRTTVNAGPMAADFTVPTLGGGSFTLSLHREKPVILYAMAYWCGSCVPEARALAKLHKKYDKRIIVVALDVDPSSTGDKLRQFRSRIGGADYIWAFDEGGRVTRAYGIRSLDSTFIIDSSGRIVYSGIYSLAYDTLEEQIKKLLGD